MNDILDRIKEFFVPLKTKTVLVIDDSEMDRKLAARALARHYHVLTASGGREGVDVALKQRPDLILLDYMMPDIKGPEVCRLIKHAPGMQEVPVIFLTSMDTPQTVVDGLEQGAEAYLTKPAGMGDILREVRLRIAPVNCGCEGKDS